jgi:hypothetical protein
VLAANVLAAAAIFGWRAFSRPPYGALAVVFTLPHQKTAGTEGALARYALTDIFTALAVAGTNVALARGRDQGWRDLRIPTQFLFGIALFLPVVGISFFVTETPARSIVETFAYLVNMTLAALLVFHIRTRRQLERCLDVWERVVLKIRTGMMPPAGARRPEREVLDSFASALESRLDQAALANPNPGAPSLSRLNRTEYANAVRDLLELDVDVTTLLPGDESSHGFDNIADALSVSPALASGYVSAAMKISRLAVGDRTMLPVVTQYTAGGLEQDSHVDGLPLGTRGGMLDEHTFPLDGEYEFAVGGDEFTIDGERVDVRNPRNFRLPIGAGPHRLGTFIVDERRPDGVDELWSVAGGRGRAPSITINGPFNPTRAGELPSRRRIFVCSPQSPGEEQECATQIVASLATVRNADRIAVIDAGRVVEIGTHDELSLRPDGLYRHLSSLQFGQTVASESG